MEKAYFTRTDKPSVQVPCLFNPKELTVQKSNQFEEVEVPGLPSPIYRFVKGNARTITLNLFFDTFEEGIDVRTYTDQITGWDPGSMYSRLPEEKKGLMDVDSELHAPPVCLFIWGSFIFQCIIESVTKKFTLFLPEGIPVRATLTVALKESREGEILSREIDVHSADLTKKWKVTQGDSLWSIAAVEYRDPSEWRLIADANEINNPRILEPGQQLLIPVKD